MKKFYLKSLFLVISFVFSTANVIFAQATDQTFSTPGTFSYVIPAGNLVTITVEVWGSGGAGGNGSTSGNARAGGGAGGYARTSVTLEAGSYQVTVGAGGIANSSGASTVGDGESSSFHTIISATGGTRGTTSGSFGSGGTGTVSTGSGTLTKNGGSGAGTSGNSGGGGGGTPNATTNAGNGSGRTGGTGINAGGSGGSNGNSGTNGASYGAGGGGKGNAGTISGNGGNGRVQITVVSNIVLPVKFGTIKASEKGRGVQIDWTSYDEHYLANYQIERSVDGINFTSIGDVAPRNVTTETQYGFFDALPLSGTSFYRIRNNDIDGKSGLSNIVKINLNKNIKTIGIYPNPVIGNRVSFQTSDLAKGTYNVEVINAIGTRVFQQAVNHAGGAINQSLNLPTLQSGQYTLRINGTSTNSTHKITILQ